MQYIYICYALIVALPIFLVLTILTATITILGCMVGDPKFWGYYPGKMWAKATCTILLLPVKVTGKENLTKNQSYVFVANHQGAFDIFLIYGYLNRNFKWMMKKGLRNVPFIGKACESSGHIFVERAGPRKIQEMISKTRKTLTNGVSLTVFPEGARTFTGHMGYFKRGAFQLANDLEMDVVPITINGSFDTMPRTTFLPKWQRLEIIVHPPIKHIEQGASYVKQTLDLAYTTIESGLPTEYQGMVVNEDQEVF